MIPVAPPKGGDTAMYPLTAARLQQAGIDMMCYTVETRSVAAKLLCSKASNSKV
jgi:hypothetical protein